MVEHRLAKARVASSNLVFRSRNNVPADYCRLFLCRLFFIVKNVKIKFNAKGCFRLLAEKFMQDSKEDIK